MSDLVERLRNPADIFYAPTESSPDMREAADRIEELETMTELLEKQIEVWSSLDIACQTKIRILSERIKELERIVH